MESQNTNVLEECFDPFSAACLACIKAGDLEEKIYCHILHLEMDHGVKIIEKDERYKIV